MLDQVHPISCVSTDLETGNVNTQMTFEILDRSSSSRGWGMRPFNASLAKNVFLVADEILQAQSDMFLSDPSHAIDITPGPLRSVPCTKGPSSHSGQSCERTFFMPGGVELAAPTVNNDEGLLETDVFLAQNQQGYLLHFQEGDKQWLSGETANCEVYGFPFGAYRLCLENAADNVLDACRLCLVETQETID